jgi:nucleoid-associated protein YgaU
MRKWLLLGIAAVLLIGIAAYLNVPADVNSDAQKPVVEAAAPTPALPPAPEQPAVKAPALTPPSFDIVRVEPTGEMVIGGRGEPGADMTLLTDGKPFDTAKVGPNGQFAMVPKPLEPGPHTLTLSMKTTDGQTVPSTQNVSVDVPETKKAPLLVAKTEAGKPTQILTQNTPEASAQGTTNKAAGTASDASTKTPDAMAGRAIVAITVVEAEDTGTLYAAGKAAAGATVRLYLNDTYLAAADVGADAAWSLKIAKGVVPGQYKVRVDDVDAATGKVLSRAEVNFDFAAKLAESSVAQAAEPQAAATVANTAPKASAAVVVDSIETATVSRGDSLWRISRKTYGSGYRYTVIHQANQEQIRDPDLIYPGQIFVLPKLNQ